MSKFIFKIYILLLLSLSVSSLAQDTSKVKKDSSVNNVILLSQSKYSYISSSSPDTITRKRFLWYPLKTIDDLFNYLPGYYLKYMDIGQVNQLSYNQLDHHYTALMRNGRPLNDLLDGSVDFNLLSRNEIEEIELSNGYGNFLYDYNNGINIINHQVFRYKPYSEISYWQDRFENLYFDGSYHQNFFRKFNFNFGITKNSYDGKYTNSDFDKWQGRFNLNFFQSSKFNSFLYVNYAKIQRGLNEGIDPVKSPLDKNTLFDAALALVKNPDAYEMRERFDVDLGFIYAYGKNKNSFTKLQLFTSNSFRKYRDEENRPDPNGILFKDNSHWINYGVKLQQVLNYKLTKDLSFSTKTEAEYDYDIIFSNQYYLLNLKSSNRLFFLQKIGAKYKNFDVDAYAKTYRYAYYNDKFYFDYGVKGTYGILISSKNKLGVFVQYTNSNVLPSYQQYNSYMIGPEKTFSARTGLKFDFDYVLASAEYYSNWVKNKIFYLNENEYYWYNNTYYRTSGINANLNLKLWRFNFELNHQYNFASKIGSNDELSPIIYPQNSGTATMYYSGVHFKGKFEVKIGLTCRYWSEYNASFYRGYNNVFVRSYSDTSNSSLLIKSNATLDFFIIGKISKATFGLTFENLLNRLYLTTGVYPYQNRGGLFNVISRFNVTWYFLN